MAPPEGTVRLSIKTMGSGVLCAHDGGPVTRAIRTMVPHSEESFSRFEILHGHLSISRDIALWDQSSSTEELFLLMCIFWLKAPGIELALATAYLPCSSCGCPPG